MQQQTVLIVENNLQMRRTIRTLLCDNATICYECSDGQMVLAAYQQFHPDWVLMDLKLEGADGLATTSALRVADPAARVVIVTSYDHPALREAAHRAGACGFVPKDDLLGVCELIAGNHSL